MTMSNETPMTETFIFRAEPEIARAVLAIQDHYGEPNVSSTLRHIVRVTLETLVRAGKLPAEVSDGRTQ